MMENQDNISPSNVGESDMGNEVSHREGVKQSVGGEGHTGQFHKVLVESELSQESDVIATDHLSSDDIHNQTTLKIRGSAKETSENAADTVQERPNISDEEYKLITKCKALITEAAGRAEERQSLARPSCSEQVTDLDEIAHDDVGDDVFVVEQENTGEKQTADLVGSSDNVDVDATYTNIEDFQDKNRHKTQDHTTVKTQSPNKAVSPTKNKNYALKCGIVSETVFDDNIDREKQVKHKRKAANDKKQSSTASPSHSTDNTCIINSDKTDVVVKQSPKRNPLSKMFKFSKRKAKVDAEVTSDTNAKKIDGIEEENISEENVNSNNVSDGEICNIGESNGNTNGDGTVIKRLNSLDSGIVVDKVTDQQNFGGVEYAVVQKKKTKGLIQTKKVDSPKKPDTENENTKPNEDSGPNNGKDNGEGEEAVYMNGNRDDQDFVYMNERAVDVSGLVEPVTNKVLETLPTAKEDIGGSDITSERSGNEAEIQSIISSDSGASSGAKYKIIDKAKPEKAKLKKKSWSFQVLGKKDKKGSDGLDAERARKVSMDPNASPPEIKKSKWLFGKFSFRRSSDDMTSSTPNLQQVGIPEEQETDGVNAKSRSKLKKKGKERKKKSPKKEVNSLERRSASLMDIVLGDSNVPRSRRSIIEDDIEYTPTDAFEGVTLSDLSQDEEAETEVALNPTGGKKSSREKNHKADKKGKPRTPVDEADASLKNIAKIKPIVDESSVKVSATASDKVEEEYMNVVEVKKSAEAPLEADNKLTSEIVEDEYVNVVADNSEAVQSASVAADQTKRIEVGGDEYAIVMKKSHITESTNVKESEETNAVEEDEELMKEYGLDKSQMIENNTEKEISEEIVAPVSSEKAYSNLIYSDEEFNASLSKLIDKTSKCNDDNKGEPEEKDGANCETNNEIDEYVQLKEIAPDHNDEMESIKTERESTSNDDKSVTEKVITEQVGEIETEQTKQESKDEGKEMVEIEHIVSETIVKVADKPQEAEKEQTISTRVKTVVMKDIGVQVPDIHMPLDIDADFGNNAGKVTSTSIGIQVDGNDLDDVSHVVVTMETNNEAANPSQV